jgi:hypothetical protein
MPGSISVFDISFTDIVFEMGFSMQEENRAAEEALMNKIAMA